MADDLSAILGIPVEQAAVYLEMAGGDINLAMNIAMDGGGGDFGGASTAAPEADKFVEPYPHWKVIWPAGKALPSSWTDQQLRSLNDKGGILQSANGPCGVLAVLQAAMWMEAEGSSAATPDAKVDNAIRWVLRRLNKELITLPSGEEVTVEEASAKLRTPVDLVEAIVLTHGVDAVKKEAIELPLVEGPNYVCSSDLMSLLLRGTACGSFSAYDAASGNKVDFYHGIAAGPGILSSMEIETKIPVADDLKNPACKVWVLHGGDHFTTLRLLPAESSSDNLIFEHFNGLPPSGPRHAVATGTFPTAEAALNFTPAPDQHKETYVKPCPGTADSIIQADKSANPSKIAWKSWLFEVVLAIDDPEVEGTPAAEDPVNDPIIVLPSLPADPMGSWRCANCYHNRFKTMCFGENKQVGVSEDPTQDRCKFCGKSRAEGGWTTWLTYDTLPPTMRRQARRMYAPKIATVLGTRWRDADWAFDGDAEMPPAI